MTRLENLSQPAQDFLTRAMPFADRSWGVRWSEFHPDPSDETTAELHRAGWLRLQKNGDPVRRDHGYMSEECSWMLTGTGSREMQRRYPDVYHTLHSKPNSDAEKDWS